MVEHDLAAEQAIISFPDPSAVQAEKSGRSCHAVSVRNNLSQTEAWAFHLIILTHDSLTLGFGRLLIMALTNKRLRCESCQYQLNLANEASGRILSTHQKPFKQGLHKEDKILGRESQ